MRGLYFQNQYDVTGILLHINIAYIYVKYAKLSRGIIQQKHAWYLVLKWDGWGSDTCACISCICKLERYIRTDLPLLHATRAISY